MRLLELADALETVDGEEGLPTWVLELCEEAADRLRECNTKIQDAEKIYFMLDLITEKRRRQC